jgi:hypothetical protein
VGCRRKSKNKADFMEVQLSDVLDRKPEFSKLSQIDQVKYMAYFFIKIKKDPIFTPKNIKDFFDLASLPHPSNIHACFNELRKRDILIQNKNGYKLHRDIKRKLKEEFSTSKQDKKVSKTLRAHLKKVIEPNQRLYLKEAIDCYEIEAYRASVIMTWILTLDHLHNYIFSQKLKEFNQALSKRKGIKINKIRTSDDFCELKESDFIEICRSAKIITPDVRKILDEKLGFRNSCAHPSGIKIKEAKATSFIEDLLDNVILEY